MFDYLFTGEPIYERLQWFLGAFRGLKGSTQSTGNYKVQGTLRKQIANFVKCALWSEWTLSQSDVVEEWWTKLCLLLWIFHSSQHPIDVLIVTTIFIVIFKLSWTYLSCAKPPRSTMFFVVFVVAYIMESPCLIILIASLCNQRLLWFFSVENLLG